MVQWSLIVYRLWSTEEGRMNQYSRFWLFLLWLLALWLLVGWLIPGETAQRITSLVLPAAILVALADWLGERRREGEPDDRLTVSFSVVVWAALLVFLDLIGPRAFGAINFEFPSAAAYQAAAGWLVFSAGVVFSLLFWRMSFGGWWTLAALIGFGGGGLLCLLLAYPVYALLLTAVVRAQFSGAGHLILSLGGIILAVVVALLIGPTAVWRSGGLARREKAFAGVIAGSMAGLALFGVLGAAVAGLLAAEPILSVGWTRVGLGDEEWMVKVAAAVNRAVPATVLTFWGLLLAGGVVGGVTAVFTPTADPTETQPEHKEVPIWPFGLLITAIPWLFFHIMATQITNGLLDMQVAQVLRAGQAATTWNPYWNTPLLAGQSLVIAVLLQALALSWFIDLPAPNRFRSFASCLGRGGGLLGLMAVSCFWWGRPDERIFYVMNGLLAVALLAAAFWVRRVQRTVDPTTAVRWRMPRRESWIAAGAAGGLIVAALFVQMVAVYQSMILVVIELIVDLSETTAVPIGIPRLIGVFDGLAYMQARAFLGLTTVGTLVGLLTGWLISLWSPQESHFLR
jgi:hypothetical protein